MQPIEVRIASETDFAGIARVQVDSVEAAQWPVGDYSNYPVLVALHQQVIIGFCVYRQSAPDEAELLNLAVDPLWRQKGVAKKMLSELLNVTTGQIFLEVAENNAAAISLYEKCGWRRVGLRPQYYQPGHINGIVMKRSSC